MNTLTQHAVMVDGADFGSAPELLLWIVQWSLCASLVVSTVMVAVLSRAGRLDLRRIPAVAELSGPKLAVIGATHVAGGLGLVLPQLTGIAPWLTPAAALGLAVQAFMAAGFHLRAHEESLEPALWGVLLAVIAVGRVDQFGIEAVMSDGAVAAVVIGLLFALTVNMVVLLRGPRNPLRASADSSTGLDAASPMEDRGGPKYVAGRG